MTTRYGPYAFDEALELRTEGTDPTHAVTKSYVDGRVYGDELQVYVDPAGDDSNPGTETEPIQTFMEAMKRVPPRGKTTVYLAAGDYTVSTENNYFGSEYLRIEGEVELLDSFTLDNVSLNVWTAQGSPGWTPDEWVGKRMRWDPYGGAYPDYIYNYEIISNTADTLTVCASTTELPPLTFPSPPDPGDSLDIVDNRKARVITPPGRNFFHSGVLQVRNVFFDGSVNNSYALLTAVEGAELYTYYCTFDTCLVAAVEPVGYFYSGYNTFRNVPTAIWGWAGSNINVGSDNVFQNCTADLMTITGGFLSKQQGYLWTFSCSGTLYEIEYGGHVWDYCAGYYLDGLSQFCRIDGNGTFQKTDYPIATAFADTYITMSTLGLWANGKFCKFELYDSDNCELLPDANFIRLPGGYVSKTDHIAYGKATYDIDKNNAVIG